MGSQIRCVVRGARCSRARASSVALLLCAAAAASTAAAGIDEASLVTCGSSIKLAHSASAARLHAPGIAYSRGSGRQSVTALPTSDDARSYWTVHGAKDAPCAPGEPIGRQQRVRLQHAASRRWLHTSSGHASPLSGNQEVSIISGGEGSDWVVSWDDSKAPHWKQDIKVTLHHAGTKRYLAALVGSAFGYPIDGHLEVCGMKKRKAGAAWYAAEGLYLPPRGVTVRGGGTGSTAARNGTDCERDEL